MKTYPGGKGASYRHLINLMPKHDTYIETHLGGGAVLRHKQSAKRNIGIDIDMKVINVWRERYHVGLELYCMDAVEFLQQYPFIGDELVYCDPPYLLETRRGGKIYRHEYHAKDHVRLLEVIKALPCAVMISGYDNPLYRDMLPDWQTYSFEVATQNGKATETVWFNYPFPQYLHDTRFLGKDFREREKIRRRTDNLKRKISALPQHELSAIWGWMQEQYGNAWSGDMGVARMRGTDE